MRSGQGTDNYVDDTRYDAAGRVTLRELGTNYTLGQTYTYYPWTQQGGRLHSLQSGLPADQDSLQSLSYSYDLVGNVETISDFGATSNPSDPQVQTFGYDALNRLVYAQAANGETYGRYPQQSYDYNDTTGNMETNAGMDYAYTYPNAPAGVAPEHGVRQVTGGIVYNGTVTVRAKRGTNCSTLPVMKLYINGTLRQQWTVNNKSSYMNYSVATTLTTDAQVDVVFSNATSGCTLQVDYVTIPTATGTRTVQAESGGTVFDRGAETGAPGANAFDGVNVINGAELMSETGSLRFVVGLNALAAGYDANGNMTLRLKDGARYFLAYDAENRLTSVSGTVSASFAYNGDGQRVSTTIDTTITTYIGGYFEWQGGAGTSYYFAGAQRIAMRTSTDLKYLLGDHLGSTSVTALASGAFDTETRYYPWGGVRWSSGASPTDYMFTGQQEIPTIGLYFYNSRFYDAALGRFVSPDIIIPNPGDPVSFDRFAYVRNSPLKYTDPSGHYPACGWQGSQRECEFVPTPTPTPVDESQLDDEPGKTGISGVEIYQWYLDLFYNPDGWWWSVFGQDSDGFSVWDAIAVIMIREAWMNWTDVNLPEAIIRRANKWCNTSGGCTIEGYINWIARYSQVAGSSGTTPKDIRGAWVPSFDIYALNALRHIAFLFQQHPPSWNEGCAPNRPCGWGNSSLYPIEVREHLQTNQTALFTYNPNYLEGNPWIIPSGCVEYNWLDKSFRNLSVTCDPVH